MQEQEAVIIFTDHAGIQAINKEYRDIDAPTDVLSFPMIEYEVPGEFDFCENSPLDYFNQDTGELMLGDIILNVDRIAEQAEEYGHTPPAKKPVSMRTVSVIPRKRQTKHFLTTAATFLPIQSLKLPI